MITRIKESKTLVKHISCDFKCKFNCSTYNSIKIGIMKHVNVSVKIIVHTKMVIVGILAHIFARMVSI